MGTSKARDITVIVNNIKTVIIWSKEHPRAAFYSAMGCIAALIAIFRFVFMDVPKWWNEWIARDAIYLTQYETGRKLIPLNVDGQEVPPITSIIANQSNTIRYALIQDNKNAPQITAIIVQFPNDAEVVTDSWNGLIWQRNCDVANRWGLAISPFEVFPKGSPYTLPALHVTFKRAGVLPFSYQINVNKMEPIRRSFTINTARNYIEEMNRPPNYWTNEVNPYAFKASIFCNGDRGQSVSPSTCLQVQPSASASTVLTDK